jgi:N-methylhydantoinase A
VRNVFARLEQDGRAVVLQAEVDADGISYARTADLRYVGQGHEISVALPPLDFGSDGFVDELFARFEANYAALFGRTVANSPVEAITWRLRASGPKSAPAKTATKVVTGSWPDALKTNRPVYFDETQSFVTTPVYDYYALPQDVEIKGPAIIEQVESTIVVGPRAAAHIDARGNLIMQIK